ncbi:MAG: methyltransferase [Lentimicrobiaceae bacterium]|nr:methyltransferase [Lentimicrobiaceae bacterium]
MAEAFAFKQFQIAHSKSAFKVGTDAVLLGSWVPVSDTCKHILDIGCGCGVIAFMLAQRSTAHITGVDIDAPSIEEAVENASNTQWKDRICFVNQSIQTFCTPKHKNKFDLIVSNPPFFVNSLKSPMYKRTISRHTDTLPFEELILSVDYCLSSSGLFAVILPATTCKNMQKLCKNKHLHCTNILQIHPTETKPATRLILLFSREEKELQTETLTIRNASMEYTNPYRLLTNDFYLRGME